MNSFAYHKIYFTKEDICRQRKKQSISNPYNGYPFSAWTYTMMRQDIFLMKLFDYAIIIIRLYKKFHITVKIYRSAKIFQ